MPKFNYKAREADNGGKTSEGTIEASDWSHAQEELRQQGLEVVQLERQQLLPASALILLSIPFLLLSYVFIAHHPQQVIVLSVLLFVGLIMLIVGIVRAVVAGPISDIEQRLDHQERLLIELRRLSPEPETDE